MHALRQAILPPSGVEFAVSLKLTPSTLESLPLASTTRHELAARALCNMVVARSHLLRIFEVREEPLVPTQADDEWERQSRVRKGTEAVEGEVEMDERGEGFVNMGAVKVTLNILFMSCQGTLLHECNICFGLLPLSRTQVPPSNDANRVILCSAHGRKRFNLAYRHSSLLRARTSFTWNCDRHRGCQNHGLY